jgi:DNA-binding transcriptional MerR regulator
MHKTATKLTKAQLPLPDKLFYKIGEVSKISGVESYVLRYWETEFPFLRPRKNKSGQRVYVKKDLELILQVKKLLYQERYTIEGVRKKLGDGIHKAPESIVVQENKVKEPRNPAEVLSYVKKRLRNILSQIR